jgi:hypothetical protein
MALASCSPGDDAGSEPQTPPPASEKLAANFPLLPVIEKNLWNQLLEAEREADTKEAERIATQLSTRHPFIVGKETLELGNIIHDRESGRLRIPAKVEFPNPGNHRHPSEVELLLCTEAGRLHETLFVTDARPLHLELLLHLSGHAKNSRFRIEVVTADGTRIPVDSLVRATGGEVLESPLLWELSGSDYNDLYSPDLSGDFAIFWHAHDSVLRVVHEGIATGVTKLEAVPHPALKNGDPMVLELIAQ